MMLIIPNLEQKIAEHHKREKKVFEFFRRIISETNIVFYKNESGKFVIPLRIQMIISFSLLDLFANYWYEYLGKTATTSERTINWYDKFCKTDKNEIYKSDVQWRRLSSTRLYEFRNSLVHFFGLSAIKEENKLYIALVINEYPEEERREMQEAFEKAGDPTIIIKPTNFHNLIKKGALLMLEEWIEVIKESNTNQSKKLKHMEGIERIYKKIRNEGASIVSKNTANKEEY